MPPELGHNSQYYKEQVTQSTNL